MQLTTLLFGTLASVALANPIASSQEKRDDVREIFITSRA